MRKYVELASLPQRLYAVGDLHGCADELRVMLDFLTTSESLSTSDQVVFIGDYIDRGEKSKDVLDALIEFRSRFPSTLFLRGNHEDMLLAFLGMGGREG